MQISKILSVAALTICAAGFTVPAAFADGHEDEEKAPLIKPIAIEKRYLEGQDLMPVDPATMGSDEGIETESPINSSVHLFHADKISAYVFDVDPGKVRINGLPYDEYVHVLKGRLILTLDDGQKFEYKKGESVIVPEGFVGYWEMPEPYREFVVINTIDEKTE